jgi:hypothetical protein
MLSAVLFTAVFPCLVVALLLLGTLSVEPTSESRAPRFAGAFGAFAVGSAYLIGLPGIRGAMPDAFPTDVTDWPWALLPLAIVMGVVDSFSGNYAIRWVLRLALVALTLGLVGGPALENSLLPGGWLQLFVMGLAVITYLWLLDGPQATDRTPTDLAGMTLAVGGTAAVIVLAESASLGQLCAVVAVALGACWALTLANSRLHPGKGLTPVLALTHGMLIVAATLYASLPPFAALVLAFTPFPIWLGRSGSLSHLEGFKRPAAVLAGVGFLISVSAAITTITLSA